MIIAWVLLLFISVALIVSAIDMTFRIHPQSVVWFFVSSTMITFGILGGHLALRGIFG